MKSYQKTVLPALLCMLLCGCTAAGNPKPEQSSAPVQENSNSSSSADPAAVQQPLDGNMPMIVIDTVSKDPNVMDFVTKPVARHVATMIASWTPGYIMPPEPYYEASRVYMTDPHSDVLPAAVDAEVKVRGNWTTNYPKKPLKLKFGEKIGLGQLADNECFKNWLLLAEYKDGSMLRDKTALHIAQEILKPDGLYASDCTLTEVQINGEYWGVYLLTEPIQVNKNRVAITEPEKDYQGTDIGYLLEFDGYFYNEEPLHQFHVDYADNAPLRSYDGGEGKRTMTCLPKDKKDVKRDIGMTIKSDIYSQEQHDFIASYVNNVYKIMYAAAYEDKAYQFNADFTEITETKDLTPQQAVEQVVNVDSLADAYIIAELTCDADIYWSSFYMDADFGPDGDRRLTFEAPWDFDSSMGNKDRCVDGTGFYAGSIVPDVDTYTYETINPWLAVLMFEDWYQDVIREKWTRAYDSGVFSRAIEQIGKDKELYADAFTRNYEKWNNIRENGAFKQELSRPARNCKTHGEAADFLAEWLTKRVDFLNDAWHS
ncbi:MAG: CotH kinase family protein [Oscillospiraceae bacterium]|nr:CotH kinase family protein [Oscillospiraceae bacterium]